MATLSTQQMLAAGLQATYVAAAAGGDEFVNTGMEFLHVKNAGASACVVTIASQQDCNQGETHNGGGSVAAGEEEYFGLLPKGRFDDVNGKVQVTYDQVVTVTVAVVQANADGQ